MLNLQSSAQGLDEGTLWPGCGQKTEGNAFVEVRMQEEVATSGLLRPGTSTSATTECGRTT